MGDRCLSAGRAANPNTGRRRRPAGRLQKRGERKLVGQPDNAERCKEQRWTPQQDAALEMFANPFPEGGTPPKKQDIAQAVGVDPTTISRWQKLPEWGPELERRSACYKGPIRARARQVQTLLLEHGCEASKVAMVKLALEDDEKEPAGGQPLTVVIVGADG